MFMNKYCVEVLLGEELTHWANEWLSPEDKQAFAKAMAKENITDDEFGMVAFEAVEGDEARFKFLNLKLVTDELVNKMLF